MKIFCLIIFVELFNCYVFGQPQFNFNAGISDFKFDDFAHSFIQQGSNDPVNVIQTAFSNTQNLGLEMLLPFTEESNWGISTSVAYRNSSLVGNSQFKYKYEKSTKSESSDAQVQYFHFKMGLLFEPLRESRIFLSFHGNFDIQYGSIVYPLDAYNLYQSNNYLPPGILNVSSTAFIGYSGKMNIGIRFNGGQALVFSPGIIRAWRAEENQYGGQLNLADKSITSLDFNIGFVIPVN